MGIQQRTTTEYTCDVTDCTGSHTADGVGRLPDDWIQVGQRIADTPAHARQLFDEDLKAREDLAASELAAREQAVTDAEEAAVRAKKELAAIKAEATAAAKSKK